MRAAARVAVALAVVAGATITVWLARTGHDHADRHHREVTPLDLLTGRARAVAERDRAEQAMMQERARAEAQAAAEASRRRRDALATAFGARPGQPGPLLDGVHFDHDEPVPAEARARLDAFEEATGASVRIFAASSPGVSIELPPATGGADAIEQAWGRLPADGTWTDEPDRVIASLYRSDGRATVSWRAFQTVDDLVAPRDPDRFGFEPSPLVGAPQDAVRAIMHADDLVSDHDLSMSMPPLAGGSSPVDVVFDLERDHVTAFRIATQAPQAADAVEAALAAKYGAAAGPWHRRGLTISATRSPDGVVIRVERARR